MIKARAEVVIQCFVVCIRYFKVEIVQDAKIHKQKDELGYDRSAIRTLISSQQVREFLWNCIKQTGR